MFVRGPKAVRGALCGCCIPSARARRELDPEAAGYGADEVMCGRARADRLRRELDHDARMAANALVDRSKRRLVRDRKREVVQADIGLAVERHRVARIGDAPNGESDAAIGDEHGRVGVVPAHLLEAQGPAEEARGLVEVANGEADMVHTVRQSVGQILSFPTWDEWLRAWGRSGLSRGPDLPALGPEASRHGQG